MCRPGTDPHLAADSVSVVVTDLSLVIGLSVAITVFLCVTSVAVRVIRSKRTSHSVYNMADMCKFSIFSCEVAALEVLMYVCPCVRPSVCHQAENIKLLKVPEGS